MPEVAAPLSWGPVPYATPLVDWRRNAVPNDTLSLLAQRYGTDKGSVHYYTPVYASVFGPARLALRRA